MDKALMMQHRRLESVIEKGIKTFIEVGEALLAIKRDASYTVDGYKDFEEYCQRRWDFTERRARQLIQMSGVAMEIGRTFPIAPRNAYQATELARAPAELRPAIWQEVIERHAGKITAADVREVVDQAIPRLRPLIPPPPPPPDRAADWRDHDAIHRGFREINQMTMVDAEAYVEHVVGFAALSVFLANDLEVARAGEQWLRRYIAAMERRLGHEQKGLRPVR